MIYSTNSKQEIYQKSNFTLFKRQYRCCQVLVFLVIFVTFNWLCFQLVFNYEQLQRRTHLVNGYMDISIFGYSKQRHQYEKYLEQVEQWKAVNGFKKNLSLFNLIQNDVMAKRRQHLAKIEQVFEIEKKYLWSNQDVKSDVMKTRLLHADVTRAATITVLDQIYTTDYLGEKNNANFCGKNYGADLDAMVFVISRSFSFEQRRLARERWLSDVKANPRLRMLFVLASNKDDTVNALLAEESRIYGDVLQLDYLEDYYLLPVKTLALLRWTLLNCINVKYVLKVDDDTFINAELLSRFVAIKDNVGKKQIYGEGPKGAEPLRDPKNKWYMPLSSYSQNFTQWIICAYLIDGAAISDLYVTWLENLPSIAIEDLWLTSMVAGMVNVSLVNDVFPLLLVPKDMPSLEATNEAVTKFNQYAVLGDGFYGQQVVDIWRGIKKQGSLS